jgi:hypothetical protein
MKLNKESKVRVFETFYALDFLFFGKPVTKVETCCPIFVEEYLSVKGALMSVVIEMLQLTKHSPKPLTEKVDTPILMKMASASAKIARENCKKLLLTDKGREDVKSMVQEALSTKKEGDKVKLSELVQQKIREKAFSLAIDNLVIARNLVESKSIKKLNEWEGKIVEDAYKILRDNLVEAALELLESK